MQKNKPEVDLWKQRVQPAAELSETQGAKHSSSSLFMLQCLLEKVIVIWHIGESPVKYSGNLEFQLASTNQQLGDINIYVAKERGSQSKTKKKALLVDRIFNLWESRYMKQENSQESSKNELYRPGLESLALCFRMFDH